MIPYMDVLGILHVCSPIDQYVSSLATDHMCIKSHLFTLVRNSVIARPTEQKPIPLPIPRIKPEPTSDIPSALGRFPADYQK